MGGMRDARGHICVSVIKGKERHVIKIPATECWRGSCHQYLNLKRRRERVRQRRSKGRRCVRERQYGAGIFYCYVTRSPVFSSGVEGDKRPMGGMEILA